jgi:TonB family protein
MQQAPGMASRVLVSVLSAALLASCASGPSDRQRAAARVAIAHTCSTSQQPLVDRFVEGLGTNFERVADDALMPAEARTRRLSGRVLVVVGYSNGERQRVGIATSSGYGVLDNHALQLVEQAAPEHAPDLPCEAATVRLGIRYGSPPGRYPISSATAPRTFATPIW